VEVVMPRRKIDANAMGIFLMGCRSREGGRSKNLGLPPCVLELNRGSWLTFVLGVGRW
jgi:hypothetical protein